MSQTRLGQERQHRPILGDKLTVAHGLDFHPVSRVAVLRALPGIGDMLCAVPAIRALRAALPLAETVLIGLPRARWFAERFPQYIDRFMDFPGWPGLPEQTPRLHDIPAFLDQARAQDFDLAVQLHGSGAMTNIVAALLGARAVAGYYAPGTFCPDPERFLPIDETGPETRRWLRLVEWLGAPSRGEELEFPLLPEDFAVLAAVTAAKGQPGPSYVCVHPGASNPERRWQAERFAEVADALRDMGHTVVLTGSAEEVSITRRITQLMRGPALDMAGATTLGALAALLSRARLLVSNDTGISHLAAAIRTPSVVVFTASDPQRWAPLDRARHRIVHRHQAPLACHDEGAPPGFLCKKDVTPADVLSEAGRLLHSRQEASSRGT